MKICIDPGHSGPFEPGACAAGVQEADVVLAIALCTGARLQQRGHEIIYTRTGDIEDDGLSFRADIANQNGAGLFLSIHANAAASETARGVEVYHYPGSTRGIALAAALSLRLQDLAYTTGRGVKEARFAVLRLTDCPAALIECAFLTNAADRAALTSAAVQTVIAEAIALAVDDYTESWRVATENSSTAAQRRMNG